MPSLLSAAQLARFRADSFVIVRAMFDAAETDLLRTAMEQAPGVAGHLLDRLAAHGAAARIALWKVGAARTLPAARLCRRWHRPTRHPGE